jgi:hypothetical protein
LKNGWNKSGTRPTVLYRSSRINDLKNEPFALLRRDCGFESHPTHIGFFTRLSEAYADNESVGCCASCSVIMPSLPTGSSSIPPLKQPEFMLWPAKIAGCACSEVTSTRSNILSCPPVEACPGTASRCPRKQFTQSERAFFERRRRSRLLLKVKD